MTETTIATILAGAGLVALVSAQVALRRRRERRDERALALGVERGLRLPASLHPVIDPDLCMGSLACLKACPEGDILGIVDGAARLVHATHCVGHGRCAAACPVQAITLRLGAATRGVELPEVDGRFESSRPGVHLIGELAGMGLVRNAVEQGAQCAGYLAEALAGASSRGPGPEVVVIGAGPAGVSCAVELDRRGIAVRLLERGLLGGAVIHAPRHALTLTGPLRLPGAGTLRQDRVGKLELLELLERALASAKLRVDEGVEVTGLSGQDGAFEVETAAGRLAARKVVLATGRRGVPRTLGVPGEDLPKVTAWLADVEQYAGARVLVVGGGDAAVEAACALADRGEALVTLSCRGSELTRCRPANAARVLDLARRRRLELLRSSEVVRIEAQRVTLRAAAGVVTLPNDFVIACLGGQPSLQFLERMGVSVRRTPEVPRGARGAPDRQLPWTRSGAEAARRRWWPWLTMAGLAGCASLVALAWVGRDYYPLRGSLRLGSPLHPTLKPASSLGVTIGIAASAVLLTNFLYALRKRWRALSGLGNLSSWLDLHVLVGVMSPLVIAFHAAFQSNNLLASGTYGSLGVLVATGLVGRYFYAFVPGSEGRAFRRAELLGQAERTRARIHAGLTQAGSPAALEARFAQACSEPAPAPVPVQLLRAALETVAFRARVAVALRSLPAGTPTALGADLLSLHRLRWQVSLFGSIHRVLRVWRSLHVSLALLLVLALLAHVSVSVYLGYGPGRR